MSGDVSSLEAAVRDHAPSEGVLGADLDAAQLDLLRDDDGKLPSNVFRLARQASAPRGPGRPKGSRNRKSDQLARLIVQKYGDPVESMAAIYAMPLDQLVETLLIADGSKDREEKLLVLVSRTQQLLDRVLDGEMVAMSDEQIDRLGDLVDKVGDLAKSLKSKPGELALKALIARRDAARGVAPYVHGMMPVQVDHTHKADVILNIPGLTDPQHLAEYVEHQELTDEDLARLEYSPFEEAGDAGEPGDEG